MFLRLLVFALMQFIGGAVGWGLAQWPGALLGTVLASLFWFAIDVSRGLRLIAWLRRADSTDSPSLYGLWGEAAERMRRLLRNQAAKAHDGGRRLEDFLAALQVSPNGVVLLDEQGRIEWCNQTAATHFGFDAQRDVLQLIGNLVRDPIFVAYYAARDYQREVTLVGRNHSAARPLKLSVQLHPYGQGRRLLLSRDITTMAQADAMRRDFVANVSHEIRTPLTVLSGFVETLQTLPLPAAEQAHYLAMMAEQAARMQGLVNDLLTLSALEGGAPPGSEWLVVDALTAPCLREARALLQGLLQAQDAAPTLDFELAAPFALAGAPRELRSALSNLINNAVRYTPPGGRIGVSWTLLPDGRAEFAVSDTGPGIAPEHLPRLGQRFYRVDRDRSRETGGTGLGLAIAKHVAQRHGGELSVRSTVGKGSRFALVFPASRVRLSAD